MLASVELIPLPRLALAFVPVALFVACLWRWSLAPGEALYALVRMVVQLAVVGYVLAALFQTQQSGWVLLVVVGMTLVAGAIALRTSSDRSAGHYARVVAAILAGGGPTLAIVTQSVLNPEPWFEPRLVIPLAGMIFANAMNALGVAIERFEAECSRGTPFANARGRAVTAALIPTTNSLLAVGLVAIPGMMTGQVLAGEDPLIAARYQVMVMAMVYGSAGLSLAAYFVLQRPDGLKATRPGTS